MNTTTEQVDPIAVESGWSDPAEARYRPTPLAEFLREDVPRTRWAVAGVWAEKRSGIIAGRPKDGKTTIATELAVSLATGQPFLGQEEFASQVAPAAVTYIQAENSNERVRRDLDQILEARGLGYMAPVINPLDPDGQPLGDQFQPTWGANGWEPDLEILSHPGMDLLRSDADREWLLEHAGERDYVFLDPAYLLASANPNDMRDVMDLLSYLNRVRERSECGVILTHQMTDKHGSGAPAARMLGSTLFHGWYEAAILVKRSENTFTLTVDNRREMSEERKITVQGLGVGSWYYVPGAQDKTDARGRSAPQISAKELRFARLRELLSEHGDAWTNQQYADELGVGLTTLKSYKREIARPETA